MLFSDEAVYAHLTAHLDTAQGSLPTGYWVSLVLFYFSSTIKSVAKEIMFNLCPRCACFHAQTFLPQLLKDSFNCVSFQIAGTASYRTCPFPPLSLISYSFPEHE